MLDLERYALKIGKFWGNFNSLELLIRLYLYRNFNCKKSGLDVEIGDEIDVNPINNFDTFSQLCDKLNNESGLSLDFSGILTLRDAMAHGRITTLDVTMPLTVIKFSKPKNGKVTVETRIELTDGYLDETTASIRSIQLIILGLLNAA